MQACRKQARMRPMSTAILPLPRPQQRDPLVVFLIFSILFHFLFFTLFPLPAQDFLAPAPEQLTEVELLPPEEPKVVAKAELSPDVPPKTPEKPAEEPFQEKKVEEKKAKPPPPEPLPEQIVSPPDEVNDQIPDETRFLSDRNTTAQKETVAVGTPLPASNPEKDEKKKSKSKKQPEPKKEPTKLAALKPPLESPVTKKPPIEKKPEKVLKKKTPETAKPGTPKGPKRIPQLFARPDDLLSQGFIKDRGREQDQQNERRPPTGNELLAMAPPIKRGFLSLPGPTGTPDHLPDVQQGKMTFLNTKAHRFAPFVRRVAQRVFQHLVISQRRNLQLDDVVAARDWVTIEAKLTVDGELTGLVLRSRSGSYSIDESLLNACQQGAWDQNPPSNAQAEDGFIHFIFRSEINAQYDELGLKGVVTFLQVGLT